MLRGIIAGVLTVLCCVSSVASGENVTFAGKTVSGDSLTLTGILTKPDGNGPFPAVVLLHSCSGIRPYHDVWAARLASWDYVALQVDSLGPRHETSVCNDYDLFRVDPQYARMPDAYAARSYLTGLPLVDGKRIALMGWSHGGWTTLYAVDNVYLGAIESEPFKAAIAFYPYCVTRLLHLNTPLLILIGEADDWTPAFLCKDMRWQPKTTYEVIVKVYPRAYHVFDAEGVNRDFLGHHLEYDPVATADAIERVKDFLGRHLR